MLECCASCDGVITKGKMSYRYKNKKYCCSECLIDSIEDISEVELTDENFESILSDISESHKVATNNPYDELEELQCESCGNIIDIGSTCYINKMYDAKRVYCSADCALENLPFHMAMNIDVSDEE